MDITINWLAFSALILFLAALVFISISSYKERATGFKEPSKKERRAYPRYKISLRIKYKVLLEEGVSWIKDISENGARIYLNNTLKTLEINESLGIKVYLPYESQPIFVLGNIVWSNGDEAGFHFEKIAQGDISRLMEYINRK